MSKNMTEISQPERPFALKRVLPSSQFNRMSSFLILKLRLIGPYHLETLFLVITANHCYCKLQLRSLWD